MSLFDEALAESKKLKEVAEQNAKNRIIEAVSPKIKELIEKQLLGEENSNDDEDDILYETVKDLAESENISDENINEGEEFVLNTESAKMLAGLLKEDNVAENIELNMFRLHNKLQMEIAKENKSIENLVNIKKDILNLSGQLNENKENVMKEEFEKFDKNISYFLDSTNKMVRYQIFKTFDMISEKVNNISKNNKIKKENKKVKISEMLKHAKDICSFINENKLVKEKKDFNLLTKKLNSISSFAVLKN